MKVHPSARIASKICSVCGLKSCRYTHSSSKMLHIPLQTRELINVYIWRGANYPHPSDTTLLNTSNLKMTLQLRVHSRTPAPVGFFSRGGQIRFLRAKVPQRGQGWSPVPTEAENNACINNSYIERFAVTTKALKHFTTFPEGVKCPPLAHACGRPCPRNENPGYAYA